jgi:hypothetical protein
MAWRYYADSVTRNDSRYDAVKCESYEEFLKGIGDGSYCDDQRDRGVMGFRADSR